MKRSFPYALYLILSENGCLDKNFIKVALQAVRGGVDLVQLREKHISETAFIENALRLQDVLSSYSVPLIINDNVEVAMSANAYGIHVGSTDISPLEIRKRWFCCQSVGYSIEAIDHVDSIAANQSDCLGISPIYKSKTKLDTVTEWGLDGIQKIRTLTNKPLIAIGNMNVTNAYDVVRAGADCIAVSSAICHAENPMKAAYELKNTITRAL
jgi:thiamine-phosphate pyrophosphorylase